MRLLMTLKTITLIGSAALCAALIGCNQNNSQTNTNPSSTENTAGAGNKPVVGFAQANSKDPWRQVFNAQLTDAAKPHAEHFTVSFSDGGAKSDQQIGQVENFITQKVAVLLISPNESEPLTAVCERAFDAGIPVVLLDRKINSEKYTAWIGGDNTEIGRQVAEYIGKRLNGKGKVLIIQGVANASATTERREGALEVWKAKYPGIQYELSKPCNYEREPARSFMENYLQQGKEFDAIYAQNDEMAIGAYLAMEQAKYNKPRIIVGVDAVQQEIVNMIKEGKCDATFVYPTPGAKAIEVAMNILEKKPVEKTITLPTQLITKENADEYLKTHPELVK